MLENIFIESQRLWHSFFHSERDSVTASNFFGMIIQNLMLCTPSNAWNNAFLFKRARSKTGAWQKYNPKDKDSWRDFYTTCSVWEQRSMLILKALREIKYEHFKLKYLFIDKMWTFLIFWIIKHPPGKWVRKLWDIFTASGWVAMSNNVVIQAHICRRSVPSQSLLQEGARVFPERSQFMHKVPVVQFPFIWAKDQQRICFIRKEWRSSCRYT